MNQSCCEFTEQDWTDLLPHDDDTDAEVLLADFVKWWFKSPSRVSLDSVPRLLKMLGASMSPSMQHKTEQHDERSRYVAIGGVIGNGIRSEAQYSLRCKFTANSSLLEKTVANQLQHDGHKQLHHAKQNGFHQDVTSSTKAPSRLR